MKKPKAYIYKKIKKKEKKIKVWWKESVEHEEEVVYFLCITQSSYASN